MPQRHHIALACLAWSLAVGLSCAVTLLGDHAAVLDQALVTARTTFEKDLAFRRWNAQRGGVYVEVNAANQPNPYLDVPDRDLRTDTGRLLTMINPAYMTRQVHELQQETTGVQGHITSLKPIRPANAPDDWERAALLRFEQGSPEASSREMMGGAEYLRFMRPLLAEKSCLKCHAKQGYKEGEVRGGISVAVPIAPQLAVFRLHATRVAGAHGLIWALGMAGAILGGRRLGRSLREAEESRQAAENASQSKSEFLANMSHEIRTPLNGVLGMLQLLRDKNTPEEQLSYVDMAYDSGRRLLSLLNDILDFSRMEAGGLTLHREPFALRATFESVANIFQATCTDKRLALSFQVDESVPEQLLGDEARLRQVLFNLVGNAVKFTPEGRVSVTAWARPMPRAPGRFRLYLEVSDTGVGIPVDKLGRIFERFTQADGSHARRFEGAGLGLAIVRRIVELMGGGIEVDSEQGVGTTFGIDLPLDAVVGSAQAPESSGRLVDQEAREPLRILLVEDEPVSKLSTQLLLSRLGHEVVTAVNGFEAVALYRNGNFDCVLMDVQMPEMDGVEATHVIRSLEKLQARGRVPIIALTAYAMSGDRERFLAEGMDDHVGKPVQLEDLVQALRKLRPAGRA
ncbi:MAG: hypothetical protein A2051_06945 [Desulfovibrionales bacterium GWA2_65_9]|nr:MAG: hypothetical protein A2051_06945 [Desulfovibrionales bacterium GWA2_65_9]